MDNFLELITSENFVIMNFIFEIILLIVVVISLYFLVKLNRDYKAFMKKMGKGNNLPEMLKEYLDDVELIKRDNSEIKAYYTKLDSDISSCIQKVGLVRYNAFKDVGSDLSFAIAFLDREDNGVVFNGIYGSESSNIYAKPIKRGQSQYQLSEEEKYAIDLAEQSKNFITKHRK